MLTVFKQQYVCLLSQLATFSFKGGQCVNLASKECKCTGRVPSHSMRVSFGACKSVSLSDSLFLSLSFYLSLFHTHAKLNRYKLKHTTDRQTPTLPTQAHPHRHRQKDGQADRQTDTHTLKHTRTYTDIAVLTDTSLLVRNRDFFQYLFCPYIQTNHQPTDHATNVKLATHLNPKVQDGSKPGEFPLVLPEVEPHSSPAGRNRRGNGQEWG